MQKNVCFPSFLPFSYLCRPVNMYMMKRLFILLTALCCSYLVDAQSVCPSVTDADGYTYKTVRIGNQCWMAENVRATRDRNGREIALTETHSATVPYRYCPNGRNANVAQYGYLYNWEAAKVVCPKGWHLPSDAEWTQMTDYVNSQPQYACGGNAEHNAKALAAATGWKHCKKACTAGNNPKENNATGFSVLPAGGFYKDGYGYFGNGTFFWTATAMDQERAYKRYLDYDGLNLVRYDYLKIGGGAVRCVQDVR